MNEYILFKDYKCSKPYCKHKVLTYVQLYLSHIIYVNDEAGTDQGTYK